MVATPVATLIAEPPDDPRVYARHLLWRCLPCGTEMLTFRADGTIERCSRACCFCCCGPTVIGQPQLRAGYQPFCNAPRLLRDVLVSFLVAFLFHLIPSILWGAEESLGSPDNHRLMGAVWFGGWPMWFLVLSALRTPGLHLDANPGCCSAGFVPMHSYAHAEAVAAWRASHAWRLNRLGADPVVKLAPAPAPAPLFDAWMLAGLVVWAVLVGNAIYVAAKVLSCHDRGCCRDDAATLDCCVATGYPNATSCGL